MTPQSATPQSATPQSATPQGGTRLALLVFGLGGPFAAIPLAALLAAGHDVRAVVLPALGATPLRAPTDGVSGDAPAPYRVWAPRATTMRTQRRRLPLLTAQPEERLVELATARGISVLEVARLRDARTLAALAAFAPDALCVAGFSRRIPTEVLELPRLGCLNLHPSLLPDNRGADPLFWTFQRGDIQTGVTVHLMDAGFDTGPILAQERFAVPEGITEAALERQCATAGGRLLVQALDGLATQTLQPVPQDERHATRYPWPDASAYTITPLRSARWAYCFACGVGGRALPISIVAGEHRFRVLAPLDYDAEATLDVLWRRSGDVLALRCTPGVFRARVA